MCTLGVPERQRAVEDFYAHSRREFEDADVKDLSMVVTRVQSGATGYLRWAVPGPQGALLTRAGRRLGC